MVAIYFHDQGHRHVAYAGVRNTLFDEERKAGFETTARKLGMKVHPALRSEEGVTPLYNAQTMVLPWLQQLPKPVGIMACNDLRARDIHRCCQLAELPMPEAVALVGMDNDDLICDFYQPPLSSINTNANEIGFQAGQLAWRLACGEKVTPKIHRVPPRTLVVRHSSDGLVTSDELVREALALMRADRSCTLTVGALASQLACSRRKPEMRFQAAMQRSAYDELLRLRCERAKELLLKTDMKIPQIATQVGQRSVQRFGESFSRVVGMTPGAYRKKFLQPGS
jgi:LacI family transcriptional regulator